MTDKIKFTKLHRCLHWTIAVSMLVLFITGFLRMFWMNKHHIVEIISEKTEGLTKEQMTDVATTIRAPMWEWHVIFAHVLLFAFIIRIIYMLSKGIRFPSPFEKGMIWKDRLQGVTYIYFYLYILMAATTGFILHLELFSTWKKPIEGVHKWGLYLFPIFLILHFAGIILAEHSHKKGIVSKMIGGENKNALPKD